MSDVLDLLKSLTLAVVDVETTSLEPESGEIIEIGIARFENGIVTDRYNRLIKSSKPLPEKTIEITGITNEELENGADASSFSELAQEVLDKLTGTCVVAYNLPFDMGYISYHLSLCGLAWPKESPLIDPLVIARKLLLKPKEKKLGSVCEEFGVPLTNAHRAIYDAEATGHLLFKMAERFRNELPSTIEGLTQALAAWHADQERRRRRMFKIKDTAPNTLMPGAQPGLHNLAYGTESDPLRALYLTVTRAKH